MSASCQKRWSLLTCKRREAVGGNFVKLQDETKVFTAAKIVPFLLQQSKNVTTYYTKLGEQRGSGSCSPNNKRNFFKLSNSNLQLPPLQEGKKYLLKTSEILTSDNLIL